MHSLEFQSLEIYFLRGVPMRSLPCRLLSAVFFEYIACLLRGLHSSHIGHRSTITMPSWNDLPFELKQLVADQVLANAVVSSCEMHYACNKVRSLSLDDHIQRHMNTTRGVMFEDYLRPLIFTTCPKPEICEDKALEDFKGCLHSLIIAAPELKAYVEKRIQVIKDVEFVRGNAAGQPLDWYYRAEQSRNFYRLKKSQETEDALAYLHSDYNWR